MRDRALTVMVSVNLTQSDGSHLTMHQTIGLTDY